MEDNACIMAAAILQLQTTIFNLMQRVQQLESALTAAATTAPPRPPPRPAPRTFIYPPGTGAAISITPPAPTDEVSYSKKLWLKKKMSTLGTDALKRVVALLKKDCIAVDADEVELDLDDLPDATLRKLVAIVAAAPAPLKRTRR